MMLTMRYVAYLRVSTDGQADDGMGLQLQEDACRAWLKAGKHRLVAVCTDAGRSGLADVADRQGLADAIGHVLGGRADGVLVYRLDRLARSLVLQETLLADLAKHGAQVHSCSATEDAHLVDDPDDPPRKLVRQVLGAVAGYERDMIRLRLRSGQARKLQEQGWAGGRPPYGWAAIGRQLVEVPDEQAVIRHATKLHESGASFRSIAAQLESDGIKSRKPDGKWRPETLAGILRRGTGTRDYRKVG